MIPFDEIDARLDKLGLDRAWLAEKSGRKINSIRVALAPNSDPKNRSEMLQRALSEAIEREEEARRKGPVVPDRITLEVDPRDFEAFNEAALSEHLTLKKWAIAKLNEAAAAAKVVPMMKQPWQEGSFPARDAAASAPPPALEEEQSGGGYWLDQHGGIAAGAPIDAVDWSPIRVRKQYAEGHYALRVFGRSMEPKIKDGSLIVVREFGAAEGTPKKGTIVVYSDANGSTLKEFGYRKATAQDDPESVDKFGNVAVLRSLNKQFPEVQAIDGGRINAVFVEVLD